MRITAPGKSPGSTRAAESTPHSAELRIVAALCAARERWGARPHDSRNGNETISDVRLDPRQVPARAELLLAAELGDIELLAIP